VSNSRIDAALGETERQLAARDTGAWASIVDRLVAECHPEQRAYVLDPGRYLVALVGRGGGKTTGGNVRFVRRMLTRKGSRCLFVARTRLHAKTLIWAETKDMFDKLGFVRGVDITYNETELTATIVRNGSSLRLVGADKAADLESLRGKTWNEVVIDEAASHPDRLLEYLIKEVIGARLVGALSLIGTAGKRLKGLFYEASRRGSKISRPWGDRDAHPDWRGWSLHRWSLKSAIEATRDRPIAKLLELRDAQEEEFAAHNLSPDNPARKREYDAEWASDETTNVYRYQIYHPKTGELWNQWDPPRVGPMALAELPAGFSSWVHVLAMDPGYSDSDPLALNLFSVAVDDPTRTVYHRWGFEASGMYAQPIAKLLIGDALKHDEIGGLFAALGEWPNALVADPAHAKAILAELDNVYGIHFEAAEKGFRYKVGAIEVVNGDLVEARIKALKDSQLEAQLLDLQWDESARTGEQIERKGQPNHSTDCLVYARAAIATFITASVADRKPPTITDPRAPGYVPPLPTEAPPEDYSHLMGDQTDYAALLGG
jgi:hypothetical protein